MKRKGIVIAAGCAVVGVVTVIAVFRGPREPEYQGRKLSYWLWIEPGRPGNHVVGTSPVEAIEATGTNALLWLVSCADYEVPAWKVAVIRFAISHPTVGRALNTWVLREFRQADEAVAYCILMGKQAATLLPEVCRRLERDGDSRRGKRMIEIVGGIGAQGCDIRTAVPSALRVDAESWKRGTNATHKFVNRLSSYPGFFAGLTKALSSSDLVIRREAANVICEHAEDGWQGRDAFQIALACGDPELRGMAHRYREELQAHRMAGDKIH